MKHFVRILILLLVLSTTSTIEVSAQNPAQSKKYQKKAKAAKKKKKDPYTPVYHDADSDHDGVPDSRDQCIHTPKGEPVTPFGCPYDVDFDGIFDYEDSCRNEAGPRENHGCPWGDKDGDGIMDNVDDCPTVPGLKMYKGCPDTDGDGIPDNKDKCPKVPGTLQYDGCPPPFKDSDGDGVEDYSDLCPSTPGPKTNRGCPELKPAEKAALQKAFDNLLFETGSDVIVSSSFQSLDDLAKVLRNNPLYNLYIEGHTDNVGDDEANLDLSKRRAISVKNYLVSKGVGAARLTTDGFGEARPVDTNDTPEGRKKNRRVEMHILQ
ncbi:OmpA family protein [Cytophaga hutchinsonii]|jgi:OOP family OmpA-OmpF porin|uniref:Possible outer membrane protein n=1 Tax=Cytophaga hutchinsonii (strain ATCC 33406 / DSM 1761 / CIP 103989 / NBRC 15051 / NCIMB 9469 / D465) TaxID=269798 RepID=A0A6N4STI5_CYTH3|nr:OmpA family protein [Cytophaga hutchinsonii]ABG59692.1 possible outer membrane protein [Cytophaga hutchinsonii ATCC 33406]SFX65833.1 Outer membrane protein OmpA [Cytophaga hutchinsonii ATCC 33406]